MHCYKMEGLKFVVMKEIHFRTEMWMKFVLWFVAAVVAHNMKWHFLTIQITKKIFNLFFFVLGSCTDSTFWIAVFSIFIGCRRSWFSFKRLTLLSLYSEHITWNFQYQPFCLNAVLPFLLPVKAERDVFDDFSFFLLVGLLHHPQ